ncbi:hypothetical protein H6P81_016317 [Aristolochia fimbriata]|uniref:NADH dehydrogenase [ubiquinone] 1 beta subcomplex subunit 4 n=1 Tax=Aristolochia fimbriata TaxID=158543 RepID=A0AAV7EB68_ARIFI|nr:hypothetical protein H6P81_016317 [Aristolochia fimbriata]
MYPDLQTYTQINLKGSGRVSIQHLAVKPPYIFLRLGYLKVAFIVLQVDKPEGIKVLKGYSNKRPNPMGLRFPSFPPDRVNIEEVRALEREREYVKMRKFDPWPVFFRREWKRNWPFLVGFAITGTLITKLTLNLTDEDAAKSDFVKRHQRESGVS